MLFKFKNYFAFVKLINLYKNSSFILCNHFLFLNVLCVVMTDHSKYTKYIYHNCLCIDISLKFLNCTNKKLKFKLKLIVKKHAEHFITVAKLNTKLIKLFNQIKHNKLLFILKICCVATEFNDDNNETKNENNSFNIL